jgi:4-hydroxyproline epimerase
MADRLTKLRVVDSHTGGEPTRVIVEGGPRLRAGTMSAKRDEFRRHHDYLRNALVNEPRGSGVVVGAVLTEPVNKDSAAGVIFFNNVGYLGMCVHGTIGVIVTLAHLGRIRPGHHAIDTAVGTVRATLHERGQVTVTNVPSRRTASGVTAYVQGYGMVRGDIAWGGNWFFLVNEHPFTLDSKCIDELTRFTWAIRQALVATGIRGDDGAEIDHIELFSPSRIPGVDSRNFVLCPGKAYDRSPCGTGTSAKLACLYADGKLQPGGIWRQESILGSVFEGQVQVDHGEVIPIIKGAAYITSEGDFIFDPADPFRYGVGA